MTSLNAIFALSEKADDFPIPPAGKVYIAYKNGSLSYIKSTGAVQVLSTGVTAEEVLDIIGAFFNDSNTIDLIYNDNGNVITANVIQSSIDHTAIANRGANSHAQIDAHLANTNNPHATTASQVGADPVGSAAAAQAVAVQRANHTGTQPANTVLGVTEHFGNTDNPHATTASQVGADPAGSAAAAQAAAIQRANHTGTQPASSVLGVTEHFADTNNPHATTAVQVGADPVGSAAAAQANAVQRANHTGTQTASTISDLANAVRNTGLTGFTVGANATVATTDSVLLGFGKTQGQIDALKTTVLNQILGDQFQQFLDNTAFATTSTTNVVAATFTTTSKPAGTYRIGWKFGFVNSTITVGAIFGLYVDGVLQDFEMRWETSDLANSQIVSDFTYITFVSTAIHTVELRVRNSAAQTCTVNPVRVEIWRVS